MLARVVLMALKSLSGFILYLLLCCSLLNTWDLCVKTVFEVDSIYCAVQGKMCNFFCQTKLFIKIIFNVQHHVNYI